MSSSRGSAKNFEVIDFASAVSESITVRTSLYNERVCGKLAQMPDSRKTVGSQYEPNGCAVCNCRWRNRASRGDPCFHRRRTSATRYDCHAKEQREGDFHATRCFRMNRTTIRTLT